MSVCGKLLYLHGGHDFPQKNLIFRKRCGIILKKTQVTGGEEMMLNTVSPLTGNVSVNTYLIIVIIAAVVVAAAVIAGVISKKKKK